MVQELSENKVRPTKARVLGSAFYSSASQIALRMISPHPVGDLQETLRERVRNAISALDPGVQRRILQDNAAELYKIEV